MLDLELEYRHIRRVSKIFERMELRRDKYEDPRYFPPPDCDVELQLAYYTVMVGIDHRTSSPFGQFEGYVDGEFFHGADLLYRLGMKIFEEEPEFFLAENLARLASERAMRLISFNGKPLWDYHVRTLLIRDIGIKVMEYYDGSFRRLLNINTIAEMIERLSIMRAYEDPVHKKIYLLAKFLDGRGLLRFRDPENFHVPVDNHLARIAIRLGIVMLSDYEPIIKRIEVTRDEDITIRTKIMTAWKEVSKISGYDPFTLDDFLWSFGRKICTRDNPKCQNCPLNQVCIARENRTYWPEHRHTLTWYY